MLATVNPRNNLAHCFGCQKNLNNIDLLMTLGYDFRTAVTILERLLHRHQARLPQPIRPTAHPNDATPIAHPDLSECDQNLANQITARRDPPALVTALQSSSQFGKPPVNTPRSIQRQFGNKCDHNSVRDR
jgi:hypothetical protein